jgi:hypothetical protein
MFLDKRNHEEVPVEQEIEYALDILAYNQGFIQFADSKANALLLINSIFLASIGPFIDVLKKGANPMGKLIAVVFFLFCILSILLTLAVIMTRKLPTIETESKGLIFYGHIADTRSPEGYIHEFKNFEASKFRESLLSNIFVVSKIATTKFAWYGYGQVTTLFSCFFWILTMAFIMLN